MNESDIKRIEKFAKKNNFDGINTDTALALITLQEHRKDIRMRVNELTYPFAVNKHRHVFSMLDDEFPNMATEKILWALLRHGYISERTAIVLSWCLGLFLFVGMVTASNLMYDSVFPPIYVIFLVAALFFGALLHSYLNGEFS